MPATRTQIYLTEAQRRGVDAIARAEKIAMAEVIRRALDAYLIPDLDVTGALAATFGADPAIHMPSRDEWSRG